MIQAVLFLFSITAITTLNVGTVLYNHVDNLHNTPWTEKDMLMLHSRMLVENLIPKNVIDGNAFLNYIKLIIKTSETIVSDQTRRIAMVSVADAIGGYLHGMMLPHVNQEYYKGHESFEVTNELHALSRKINFILDTDGRGWMTPVDIGWSTTITAITRNDKDDDHIDKETDNPCAALLLYGVPSDGQPAAVPMPAFDDNLNPGSLAFPFAVGKQLFAVDRPWMAADDRRPLLVRYYRLAAGCTSSAPEQFRADINRWLDEVVVPLLTNRRRWYPVLVGASRVVLAAAKATGNSSTAVGGRPKRGATATTTTTAATNDNNDDIRRSCDDGPDSRVPNSNVPLAVILVSLVLIWITYGCLFGKKQQSQTFTI